MKKGKDFGLVNLLLGFLLLGVALYMYFFELNAINKMLDGIEDNGERLGSAIGGALVLVLFVFGGILEILSAIFLFCSAGMVWKRGRRRSLILGIVGKFLAALVLLFGCLLTVSGVSVGVYAVLAATYILSGVVDIVLGGRLD